MLGPSEKSPIREDRQRLPLQYRQTPRPPPPPSPPPRTASRVGGDGGTFGVGGPGGGGGGGGGGGDGDGGYFIPGDTDENGGGDDDVGDVPAVPPILPGAPSRAPTLKDVPVIERCVVCRDRVSNDVELVVHIIFRIAFSCP